MRKGLYFDFCFAALALYGNKAANNAARTAVIYLRFFFPKHKVLRFSGFEAKARGSALLLKQLRDLRKQSEILIFFCGYASYKITDAQIILPAVF